jgi:CubicO group peptidase (beta-lactamase class C family)
MNTQITLTPAPALTQAFPAVSQPDTLQKTGARLAAPAFHYRLLSAGAVIADCFSGYRNLERQLPATPETQYALFSVTKTFTALAVLQLAEAGRLHLDEEATAYLPQYGCLGKTTLRQLLAHQSGLNNPLPLRWIHSEREHARFDYGQFTATVLRKAKGTGKPGEKTAYSNLNYLVLGEIMEKVAGCSYQTLVEREIIRKITNGPGLGFEWHPSDRATGYHPSRSLSGLLLGWLLDRQAFTYPASPGWTGFHPFYTNGLPYGGLLASAGPLAEYLRTLLSGNPALLSKQGRRELFTEQPLRNGKPGGMALGWFTGKLGGHAYLHHAGGGGGFYCEARIYPDAGLASLLLTNKTGFSDARLLDRFDRIYL